MTKQELIDCVCRCLDCIASKDEYLGLFDEPDMLELAKAVGYKRKFTVEFDIFVDEVLDAISAEEILEKQPNKVEVFINGKKVKVLQA